MITLRRGTILHKLFLFPLSNEEKWRHEDKTNLCFVVQTLLLRLPSLCIVVVVFSPIWVPLLLVMVVAEKITESGWYLQRKINRPKSAQPRTGLSLWIKTIKGRICPAVTFE